MLSVFYELLKEKFHVLVNMPFASLQIIAITLMSAYEATANSRLA